MVKKRVATVLCTVASVVGYVVGTYGDLLLAIVKRIVEHCGQN